jgi:hypothetical protein
MCRQEETSIIFVEGLLALVPFAVLGTLRLLAWTRNNTGLASFLAGVIFILLFLPNARAHLYFARIGPHALAANNSRFRKTAARLEGLRLFSTVPRACSIAIPRSWSHSCLPT